MKRKPTIRKKIGAEQAVQLQQPAEEVKVTPAPVPAQAPVATLASTVVQPLCTTTLPTYSTISKLKF